MTAPDHAHDHLMIYGRTSPWVGKCDRLQNVIRKLGESLEKEVAKGWYNLALERLVIINLPSSLSH